MFGRRVKVSRDGTAPQAVVLRTDIGCGVAACGVCASTATGAQPLNYDSPVLVPDVQTLAAYADIFDDVNVSNVLVLSTVVTELNERHRGASATLKRLTGDPRRGFYVFGNDRHASAAAERTPHESVEDFQHRALRKALQWLNAHAVGRSPPPFLAVSNSDAAVDRLTGAGCQATLFSAALAERLGPAHPLMDRLSAPAATPEVRDKAQDHLSDAQLRSGLNSGEFVKGKLRTSEGSCFVGEIRGQFRDCGERIMLLGRANVNRAVHDDVVVVRVDSVEKWRPASKSDKTTHSDAPTALKAGFTPTGRVVGILERHRRPYCGSIDVADGTAVGGLSGTVSVLFRPKSQRIPRIRITTKEAENLRTKRLRVVIDDWPVNAAFPVGHYTDVMGLFGDMDTEATVILLENDIPHYDFSEAVYDCLPKGTWAVEASEEAKRTDLRHIAVSSVDPLGCRDIDDALHFRTLENGDVEVGVHIADVSHFVLAGTPLDEEAAKRSTSVYLVDRRINMLPQLLTENLCSIVGNEDRYAFSVLWVFEGGDQMKLKSEWFGKTIIRSRAALYYGDAQNMIDNAEDNSEVTLSLRGLMRFSRILKQRRDEAGALTLGSQEFKFKIDNDHVNPTDMVQYQTFETNSMVEEWMLYANVAAARWCYREFPAHALLRRHQAPADRACADLNSALVARGLPPLDTSTSKALNMSLNACKDANDPYLNKLVRILTTRCLKQAQYFCSGDMAYEDFLHYGLAMPIYTHFTSPIRRYADVIVHRQLAAITGFGEFSVEKTTSEDIGAVAANINYRHEMAQKAGRDSQNLFTGFFLRKYAEAAIPVEKGYVVKVSESFVSVMVPSIGQEGRVPAEVVTRTYRPLDEVRVQIELVREGDVLSARLAFRIVEADDDAKRPPRGETPTINLE
jgi:exosome complex exonuclease DIS3/RRP44